MRRSLEVLVAAVLSAVLSGGLLAGCGSSGLYGAPLPGGADLGGRPYHVTAQFADVLDLVPQASVRLNDVAVGRVDQISLSPDGSAALVSLAINGDVALPTNTRAELSSASLLGEKFVDLTAPKGQPPAGQPPAGVLRDGAVIPIANTRRYPEVEEVFGALSLLLNGGGLAQLKDIIHELNAATSGNEPQLRDLLNQLARLTGQLDAQRGTIVRAIDGLDRLSVVLAGQTGNINTALGQLEPGLAVLNDQRDELVTMLKSLDQLSGVAVDTVHRGRDDLVADLRALHPTLRQLAKAGDDIPNSLQILLTYPFTDYAMNALKGDFFNTDVLFKLDVGSTLGNLLRSSEPLVPIPGTPGAPLPGVLGQIVPKPLLPEPRPPAGLGGLLLPLSGGHEDGGADSDEDSAGDSPEGNGDR
jgi:phospholipid/cholesterol/gamma-HCH transport system substrate-binding protein